MLYAFGQRSDTTAVDEPLYGHYLTHQPTRVTHPGRNEIIAAQCTDGAAVIDRMANHDYGTPLVVFKQMTHHLVDLPLDFLSRAHHVLLIRDPRRILASFGRVVDGVTALDIGIPQQGRLYGELRVRDRLTAVVDARRLLEDPAGVLRRLCDRIDIPYEAAMLAWPAGPKPYDGVWAQYWYRNVHRSTGFAPYAHREVHLSPALEAIARECEPVYRQLLQTAL